MVETFELTWSYDQSDWTGVGKANGADVYVAGLGHVILLGNWCLVAGKTGRGQEHGNVTHALTGQLMRLVHSGKTKL
ncbi:hypothetical protein GCM10022404_26030 [Celeribacter arenosi]|uniref:Uncharacterized protein n=1 Tax=Celeribacter arenosi TaxID=792649 RepID=A0ABP7KEK8_9RHOB